MGYQSYPNYTKDRRIPGANLPASWEMIPLRWFLRVGSGDFLSNNELEIYKDEVMNVPVIGGNGVMAYTNKSNTPENSIVIGRVGAHCGNVHLIKKKSWVTDNALRVQFNYTEFYPNFLFWTLKSLRLNDSANRNAQPLITGEIVKDKYTHYPSITEQQKIADFLDHKTQQIDQLIEKKKALIEKLNEQRIAVITRGLTKGLDETVPMKDSGVDWLGQVPEHWEAIKLRFLLAQNFTNGIFKKAEAWGSGFRVVNVFDIYVHNDIVDESIA